MSILLAHTRARASLRDAHYICYHFMADLDSFVPVPTSQADAKTSSRPLRRIDHTSKFHLTSCSTNVSIRAASSDDNYHDAAYRRPLDQYESSGYVQCSNGMDVFLPYTANHGDEPEVRKIGFMATALHRTETRLRVHTSHYADGCCPVKMLPHVQLGTFTLVILSTSSLWSLCMKDRPRQMVSVNGRNWTMQ